jgi:cellulose synthase (UDP-forming)
MFAPRMTMAEGRERLGMVGRPLDGRSWPPSPPAAAADATQQRDGLPARVTPERVFQWWDFPLFGALSLLGLAAMALFAVAWVRYGDPYEHPLLLVLITALLVPMLANQQGRWFLLLAMRRPRPLTPPAGLRVAVVTTYVPGAESRHMVEHSLAALVAIRYPHDTWLLDEGGDPEMRALCARVGVHYFSRKDRPEYQAQTGRLQLASKHGNYNAWLDAVGFDRYEIVVAFDPDHVASLDFLEHVLGYFRDPRIAYVQPAQAYYNQRASFIARGAAEETYAYYSAVQMASYGLGYPVIVGGHNAHRMSALKAVGGFAAHDADDLLLTLRYRAAGWQGVYVPRILARGLAPVDWRGYLTQQRRWARSVLDIKLRRRAEYAARLPLASRVLSFVHGINFVYRHVVAMFALLLWLPVVMWGGGSGALRIELVAAAALLGGALALEELYRQRFYLDWHEEAGVHWRAAVLQYASWPWFLVALVDVLIGRRPAYVVTQKAGQTGRFRPFIVIHLTIAAAVALAWLAGLVLGRPTSSLDVALAGGIVLVQGGLIATELGGFPPSWDARREPVAIARDPRP